MSSSARASTPIALISAPSDLGLKPTGVAELPRALLRAGLLHGMPHAHAGTISVPAYVPDRDSATGVLNPRGIHDVSRQLATRVEDVLESGAFPLVLGGDCSILLGVMLALKRRGRHGLLFIDGHADFYSAVAEPNGEVASMELALLTGREPQLLHDVVESPLVREEDVVVFGARDADSAAEHGSPDVRDTRMHILDCESVQTCGAVVAMGDAMAALEETGCDGFWIHLDADVLDDTVMPAVDYRMPGGLTPEQLVGALTAALGTPGVVGMDITIYNPSLDDEELSAGRLLAHVVNEAFGNSWPGPSPNPTTRR